MNDLTEHCQYLAGAPSGGGWPVAQQKRLELAASKLFHADVLALCTPGEGGTRELLDELLTAIDQALPAFSNAITHTYFSHAELERVT